MADRVEIIFLKYNNVEIEIPALVAILNGTEWPYVLTVYDNRDGTKNMAKLWNQLIRNSQQNYVVIIDSDTKVKPFWLTRMMEVMQAIPNCGVVVPRTNHCSEGLQVRIDPERAPLRIEHGLVSGFCFLLRREAFQDMIGGFDEEFGFYGQDSEFFVRMAKKSRWDVYLQPRAYVFHYGQYSVKNKTEKETYDFAADKQRALELYYQKTANY